MSRQLAPYVALMALPAVLFVVLHWIYGYVLAIQNESNDCFFMFGRQFLEEFSDHPGGLLCYAGRFLGQFYHYRWLGALMVSAWITCFGVLFYLVLTKLKSTVHVSQALFPCILLLGLHMSTVCLIQDTVGLSVSCCAFLGYLSLRARALRCVYALLATPIIYLLLGAYAWFFVVWVSAFEWLGRPLRSGLLFKISYIVFSITLALVAWRWVFPIPLRSALLWPFVMTAPLRSGVLYCTFTNLVVDCVLAAVLSVSVLLIPFWGRLCAGTRPASLGRATTLGWSRVAPAIAIPALAVLLHVIRYDASLSTFVTCRQLYKHGRWGALLEEMKKNPSSHLDMQFMTNFALYKKGRLLDEMFHYPQRWGTRGLVLNFAGQADPDPVEDDTYRGMYNSDLFYEMGHINLAFRHAYNSLHASGETYDTVERMAQCSMANGNYAMAAKYLSMLERSLFHKESARRYKAIMADPDAAEREFGDLRRRYPVVDVPMREHPRRHVAALLEHNVNPMAFDYLMAWLLLEKTKVSIAAICDNVEQFRRSGYVSIPTHCQEVMLLWERQEGTSVDLRGFSYDEVIVARVDRFLRDLSQYGDRRDAPQRMRALYGDTYMYYCFFVPTPDEVRGLTRTGSRSGGTVRQE